MSYNLEDAAKRIIREELTKQRDMSKKWPERYHNSDTGKFYTPHHEQERIWVESDTPPYPLILGGEGSGKSVAGIIKTLNRLRRGMNGIMVSPDLPHFKRSLWPEFRRWCPWQCVVAEHQNYANKTWRPSQTFEIVFNAANGTQATLICGGMANPIKWEGPNVSFAHMDEARGFEEDEALKVLAGRVRIPGRDGEPPQLYLTTTSRKHWLYTYYGDLKENDPLAEFKKKIFVVKLTLKDNESNLSEGYVENRSAVLNETQRLIRVEGEWADESDTQHLLPAVFYWDRLKIDMPVLRLRKDEKRTYQDMIVIGIDGAYSRDTFALVAVSRGLDKSEVWVRMVEVWQPTPEDKLDFQGTTTRPGPEQVLREWCKTYNVLAVVYDPSQIHDMATRLSREHLAYFEEFIQSGRRREIADQQLYDIIMQQKLKHNGHERLRSHILNSDQKPGSSSLRIVKRTASLHIDAAIALSMASNKCLEFNI